MYAGHFGVALAVKGVRREEPLATLVLASVVTDLIVSGTGLAGVSLPRVLNPHSIPGTAALCLAQDRQAGRLCHPSAHRPPSRPLNQRVVRHSRLVLVTQQGLPVPKVSLVQKEFCRPVCLGPFVGISRSIECDSPWSCHQDRFVVHSSQ